MTFQIGNEFWKQRSRHGVERMMKDPQALYEACSDYFQWVKDNPLIGEKVGFSKGKTCRANTTHIRAMTITGLCIFLGIVSRTWYLWKSDQKDLLPVMEWAEEIIRTQKLEGAAAGLLNANIISRELGLAEKVDHGHVIPAMVIAPPPGSMPVQPPIAGVDDDD